MNYIYEAVVVTNDGTFRAYPVSPTLICVTEDGVEGLFDTIELGDGNTLASAPENLTTTLLVYLYEMVRGLDVISATLSNRTR